MDKLDGLRFLSGACEGPCFYRAAMNVPEVADTFIDTHSVHKGVAWINSRPLGRFWSVGPQFTLFTPGPWLHPGANEVILFDLMGISAESVTSVARTDYGPAKEQ